MNFDVDIHNDDQRYVRIHFKDQKRTFEKISAVYLEKTLNFDENDSNETSIKKLRNGSLLIRTKVNQVKKLLAINTIQDQEVSVVEDMKFKHTKGVIRSIELQYCSDK